MSGSLGIWRAACGGLTLLWWLSALGAYEVAPGERGEASCAAFPQYSYDVYMPSTYQDDGVPFPVIYTMSFNPNGMVSTFREAGERLGMIVVGVKGVENGKNWRETAGEFYAVMRDVRERLNVDPTAQFTGGMSGGAWNAYDATKVMRPHLAGVMAMGGWLGNQHGVTDRYAEGLLVARSNGFDDTGANGQSSRDDAHLSSYGVIVRDWPFAGGHEESPPAVQEEALRWMLDQRVRSGPGAEEAALAQAEGWRQQLFAGEVSAVTSACLKVLMEHPRTYQSHHAQAVIEEIFADYQTVGRTTFSGLPTGPYVMDYLHYLAWIGKHTGGLPLAWSASHLATFVGAPGTGLSPTEAALPAPPPIIRVDLPEAVMLEDAITLRVADLPESLNVEWRVGNEVRVGNGLDYQFEAEGLYPIMATVSDLDQVVLGEHLSFVRVGSELMLAKGYPKSGVGRGLRGEIHSSTWYFQSSESKEISFEVVPSPGLEVVSQRIHEGKIAVDYRSDSTGEHALQVKASDGSDTMISAIRYDVVEPELVTFIGDSQPLRWLVPKGDALKDTWMLPELSLIGESAFEDGTNGVGYDRQTTYEGLIKTDVSEVMYEQRALLYLRIPFEVAAPQDVVRLELAVKYDDAYVAYLNGFPMVQRGMDFGPSVGAEPYYYHSDTLAVEDAVVDVTPFRGQLVEGTNWLAIGGLNESVGSSDFLMAVRLSAQVAPRQILSGFEAWIEELRPLGESSNRVAPQDDPDADGYANVDEYLFGSDPWRAAAVPTISYTSDVLTFQGRASRDGVHYVVERSATLRNDWEPSGHAANPQLGMGPGGVLVYRAEVPMSKQTQFYRVRAQFE